MRLFCFIFGHKAYSVEEKHEEISSDGKRMEIGTITWCRCSRCWELLDYKLNKKEI